MPRPITILLVDDDPDWRTLVREAIAHGFPSARTWEVPGGCDALDFLRCRGKYTTAPTPDIVYTDLEMPDMTGQELLKAVRSNPDLENIPVVLLTGVDDEARRREALFNGASGYILKSNHYKELRVTIAQTTQRILGVRAVPATDAAIPRG